MKPHGTKIRKFRHERDQEERTHCHRGRALVIERDHKDEPTE